MAVRPGKGCELSARTGKLDDVSVGPFVTIKRCQRGVGAERAGLVSEKSASANSFRIFVSFELPLHHLCIGTAERN